MSEVTETPAAPAETTTTPKKQPKAKAAAKPKSARPKTSHPPVAVMVNNAIKNLKERGGSSLQAVKKYIASTYKVDAEKMAPFIKRFIKSSVVSGSLVQTKGKGASGSFKLAGTVVSKKPEKKAVKPKAKTAVKPKAKPKVPAKKAPVKAPAKPKKAAPKKAVAAPAAAPTKPKAPPKAKKAAKTPVKKPKAPKAKTVKKSPAKAKKTAAKKK